jgi:hypothetical protein
LISPNSIAADSRKCSRMISKNIDGMVVCDDPSRRAE